MKFEIVISLVSLILAIGAFIFSILTYFRKQKLYKKQIIYQMFFELDSMFIQNYDKILILSDEKSPSPIQCAYISMAWHFIQTIYFMDLIDDSSIKYETLSFLKMESYKSWFYSNINSYDKKFVKYIKKNYNNISDSI